MGMNPVMMNTLQIDGIKRDQNGGSRTSNSWLNSARSATNMNKTQGGMSNRSKLVSP